MNSGCEASGTILSSGREYEETTVLINYTSKKLIPMLDMTGLGKRSASKVWMFIRKIPALFIILI